MKKYLLLICWFGLSVCNAQSLLKETDSDWESDSFLQTFVDLVPIGKQVYVYEDVLKIKPNRVQSDNDGTRSYHYLVKGCDFYVKVDRDNNVIEYELKTHRHCPRFKTHPPIDFDSHTSNLKQIISDAKKIGCFRYNFLSHHPRWNSMPAHYITDNNVMTALIPRVCGHIKFTNISFRFQNNDGIKNWEERIVSEFGGSLKFNKLTYEQHYEFVRCTWSCLDMRRKYNELAEAMWGNERPVAMKVD
jgi:hypothetical protein